MGSCCEPKIAEINHGQEINKTEVATRAGTSLNATSIAGLREKYERWLNEKDQAIRKNQDEAAAKQERLKQLEQAGKRLECDKIKRQIDTHLKMAKQLKEEKLKIQEKLENL